MTCICYAVLDLEDRSVEEASLANPRPRPMYAKAICECDYGLFLFSCDEQWNVMFDTLHESVDEAKQQAEFEHPGMNGRWVYPS